MSSSFVVQVDNNILCCVGELNYKTLALAWDRSKALLHNIEHIDVSKLSRVDSMGLSFLTYLCVKSNAKLMAINSQLKTLIELYDLEPIVL